MQEQCELLFTQSECTVDKYAMHAFSEVRYTVLTSLQFTTDNVFFRKRMQIKAISSQTVRTLQPKNIGDKFPLIMRIAADILTREIFIIIIICIIHDATRIEAKLHCSSISAV